MYIENESDKKLENEELDKDLGYYIRPAELIGELLYSSTINHKELVNILSEFTSVSEEDIYEIIVVMSNNIHSNEDNLNH